MSQRLFFSAQVASVTAAALIIIGSGSIADQDSTSTVSKRVHVRRPLDLSALRLTFSEDFKGGLDASPDGKRRWKTTYAWGNRTLSPNHEAQFYSDWSVGVDPFKVHDGVLDITAAPADPGVGTPEGSQLTFTSGAITTERSFSQLYGYFEICAKLPSGKGMWPAFWLLPADLSWPPELDVFEMLGHEPNKIYMSFHSKVDTDQINSRMVADTTQSFHNFGVDWEPDLITWYFDGKPVAQSATPTDMHQPMYLLANLAVGGEGSWPGAPDATTPMPAHMLIQYVRVYQHPDR
jgi:beta-glucanase (GH16 family)